MTRSLALLSVIPLVYVSCAGQPRTFEELQRLRAPHLPAPGEGNKTLLAIVVMVEKTVGAGFAFDYRLGLKERDERILIKPKSGIVLFNKLPPGGYNIDRMYIEPAAGMTGDRVTYSAKPMMFQRPVSFALAEGAITILPAAIVVSQQETGPHTRTQSQRLVPVNREKALSELSRYIGIEAWRIAE